VVADKHQPIKTAADVVTPVIPATTNGFGTLFDIYNSNLFYLNKFLNEASNKKYNYWFHGVLRALPLSYLRLRKGQVSILRPRANNAMKYLLCETIFAPSGNRNRGTSLEGKYVTTTPKVLWRPVEAFNPLDRSFSGHCELNTGPIDLQSIALPSELCPVELQVGIYTWSY
tara:strand:- start:293 stop:805 length:513 start_codon:yes stop_codon:yes gene_type:complete